MGYLVYISSTCTLQESNTATSKYRKNRLENGVNKTTNQGKCIAQL